MTGCAEIRQYGAGGDVDKNVLTGGPIRGTTIADLPPAVKDTLEERVPNESIADIDKTTRDGRPAYAFRFSGHKKMCILDDGEVWPTDDLERTPEKVHAMNH
jgi:hypothetical protein